MDKLKNIVKTLLPHMPADAVSVGVIDFTKKTFQAFEATHDASGVSFSKGGIYFDLASLTKPLTNSLSYFLKTKEFDEKMLLCLSHRGGLPAWGLFAKDSWRELIQSYPIKESPTLYSDPSALRVLLEFNSKGQDMKTLCQTVWDKETVYWLDLPDGVPLLQYGYREGEPNFGVVHDPNAYVLRTFCSHAGLFSTIGGICRTLIQYEEKTQFIAKVKADLKSHSHRFALGWDRVENPENTLAGTGCSTSTFGHLGFTGNSIWIDAEKMLGHVILSNTTKHHWFDKEVLNDLRRGLGARVWAKDLS
jgi:hypothetical protein